MLTFSPLTLAFQQMNVKAGFHIIANDHRADCSHTFRSAEISNVLARRARGKTKANNMADIEEEILLQANLFPLLVLKRRQHQLQNRRKDRFENIHEETS